MNYQIALPIVSLVIISLVIQFLTRARQINLEEIDKLEILNNVSLGDFVYYKTNLVREKRYFAFLPIIMDKKIKWLKNVKLKERFFIQFIKNYKLIKDKDSSFNFDIEEYLENKSFEGKTASKNNSLIGKWKKEEFLK